jgi:hypothetical protein
MKKALFIFSLLLLLPGWKQSPFVLEPPDYRHLVDAKTGFYVHREVELRVDAKRFGTRPENAARGAKPVLETAHFFPGGTSSSNFIRKQFEKRGSYRVWRETTHLTDDDVKGKTSLGANLSWEKPGSVSAADALELFRFPPPETGQLNNWSPWFEANSRRAGVFGWHAEVHEKAPEAVKKPRYPFQVRFRLVLSKRMYP